ERRPRRHAQPGRDRRGARRRHRHRRRQGLGPADARRGPAHLGHLRPAAAARVLDRHPATREGATRGLRMHRRAPQLHRGAAMIGRPALPPETLIPAVVLAVVLIAFLCTPLISGKALTTFDVYNTFQGLAQLGLLTLGLGVTMIAGEFDLSVVGTYALGGMIAVRTGQSSAILGVVLAVAAGATIGAVQGGLIARLRIPSLPGALATYIALLGLASAMSGGLSVTYTTPGAPLWIDRHFASIFSTPSLVTLAGFVIAAAIFGGTRLGRGVRAIGGDRRASRVAGVRVERTLVGL